MYKFVKQFNQISARNVNIAGGKAANLGEMIKIKIPVPSGFVVLASAMERFLKKTNINIEIGAMWRRINTEDMESVEENSEIIRALILGAKYPEDIKEEILNAFQKVKAEYVAVRSSATAEDSKIDSWAGELETYLNVKKENLIESIKKCWASLYAPKAILYRLKRELAQKEILVAVVVQKMIQPEVAGTCFTVHPITKNNNQMIIEAVWGLGESLVQGLVTPDAYIVSKDDREILDINNNKQKEMIYLSGRRTTKIMVPKSKQNKQKLLGKKIIELAKLCAKIEKHYKIPQDIEWAFSKNKFYVIQTRPITTL